jgi:uncharacterized protein
MSLVQDNSDTIYQLRGYRPGFIKVNDDILTHSMLIAIDQLQEWAPQSLAELTTEHFDAILALKPTIILLGTGDTLVFPPMHLYGHLLNKGIGVEVMNSSAACRTFNALAAEHRRVVAAILIK